jgi:hypothetical protein
LQNTAYCLACPPWEGKEAGTIERVERFLSGLGGANHQHRRAKLGGEGRRTRLPLEILL